MSLAIGIAIGVVVAIIVVAAVPLISYFLHGQRGPGA